MLKPRIIIAESDISYLIPIETKFVIDYFNKIDLEVITEKEYFDDFFSRPQSADILIVSEQFYNMELKKHNIGSIFVMTEQNEDGETGELGINRIYKYSSLKEIFNEIIGKSKDALSGNSTQEKGSKVILVTSAAGGVGKTTIAMGLAASLARSYQRVLYIDASYLQSFQYVMQDQTCIFDNELYGKLINPSDDLYFDVKKYIRSEEFDYVPAFKAALVSLGISPKVYKQIAVSAKNSGDYDYVIIDSDSVFDEEKLNLLDAADKVFVITSQSERSAYATDGFISNINGVSSDKYTFICNRYRSEKSNSYASQVGVHRFAINEYISEINSASSISIDALAQNSEIKKISFLVM